MLVLAVLGTVILGSLLISVFVLFPGHQHCMKAAGSALRLYAEEHGGRFPSDTNGFGNALLRLVKEAVGNVRYVTGPGDDGKVFMDALKTGMPIPEARCSRVYVQGLSEQSSQGIAILFDKKPTRGGDHFRRPWGPLVREVCLLDGSMEIIPEDKWREFSSKQVELLVREGFGREAAKHYYEIE